MHIRPIHPHEVAAFASCGGSSEHVAAVQDYLERMFVTGAMRHEWCFVAEDAGRLLGRVGYWTLPPHVAPSDAVLLDVPWEGDLAIGARLLRTTLREARVVGATTIGHILDSLPLAPQWQDHHEQRIALLERVGFALQRETHRFEWPRGAGTPASRQRLRFRSFDEVGEAAFLAAMVRVSDGTLDRRIQQDREQHGPVGGARSLLALLRQMEHDPSWWQLAYTLDGALAGLTMPARNATAATIGYIGVTPEQRGRGYSDDLLAQIVTTLRGAGTGSIQADADVRNSPMARAFLHAGWEQFATRREYSIDLAGCPASAA